VVDGGHPTIDTFLIRPRFWKKVALHGRIIEDALYCISSLFRTSEKCVKKLRVKVHKMSLSILIKARSHNLP